MQAIIEKAKNNRLFITGLGLAFMVLLAVALQKPITIEVDDKVITDKFILPTTVKKALEQNNVAISETDQVQPALTTWVDKNMQIVVNRAFTVAVIADGQRKEILSPAVTIAEAVQLAGFTIGEKDIIKTQEGEKTVPNQEIEVIRVTEQEINEEKTLPYGTDSTIDNTLERGLSKTIKKGENGLALDTIKITYYNGVEEKRQLLKSEVKKLPVNKVVAMGNITTVSRGNQRFNFREALYVQASAYTYTGHRTATGTNPTVGTVAVDPRVIPLGSKLYIEGYGYARAEDTGGAVKGNAIDLFMEQRQQCLNWGRRTVKVYVLQ